MEESLGRMEKLDAKIEINMNKLHNLVLEVRGLTTIVRPSARKNEWYGEEIDGEVIKENKIRSLPPNYS